MRREEPGPRARGPEAVPGPSPGRCGPPSLVVTKKVSKMLFDVNYLKGRNKIYQNINGMISRIIWRINSYFCNQKKLSKIKLVQDTGLGTQVSVLSVRGGLRGMTHTRHPRALQGKDTARARARGCVPPTPPFEEHKTSP